MTETIIPLLYTPKFLTRQSADLAISKNRKPDEPTGVLCFTLGDEMYGADLDLICQIVKPPPLTRVPLVEPFILGIISIRGEPVTLIDLRQFFGLEPTKWPRGVRVLVVEMGDEYLGLLVDSVAQVRRLEMSELEIKPELKEGTQSEHVLFVARPETGDQIIGIDLDGVVGDWLK
jgi:purine-binding chemotaxis protein CheW